MSHACTLCSNSEGNLVHEAREMMFGTRDKFRYLECGRCGTIQLLEVPDLAKYYPKNFYAFDSKIGIGKTALHRLAAKSVGKYFLHGRGTAGKFLASKEPRFGAWFHQSIREPLLGLDFSSRILDFGCGSGRMLQALHYFGFRDLTGADAFIENDIVHESGVTIHKKGLDELAPGFDLVMLHHVFEHLPNPRETLQQIHRLLDYEKFCLIRMPVAAFAWKKYGPDWVQLDPPRHLFIFTEKYFRSMAESSGFRVEKVVYDSDEFQFWGSEQYLRDIPLCDERSYNGTADGSVFTAEQISEWRRQAMLLNEKGNGDQACFYLRKLSGTAKPA